eukprot:CAMPEP_0170579438 /NCGR_PEP_ID=MMETSP0224-20130122/5984_1 /TAXON_ID=285029 /ORGANISM="Togula jolla, Strain CCCM 725" /LENGTH=358 /DNA_ID=CAMNT_0010902463 /DNA_START=14 /DNA_END=1087 /DNA_ORIENTATION=+
MVAPLERTPLHPPRPAAMVQGIADAARRSRLAHAAVGMTTRSQRRPGKLAAGPWGHMAILLGILRKRLLPHRQMGALAASQRLPESLSLSHYTSRHQTPRPRRRRRTLLRDLHTTGLAVVVVPPKAMLPLLPVVEGLCSAAAQADGVEESDGSGEDGFDKVTDFDDEEGDVGEGIDDWMPGSFLRSCGLNTAFPESMAWYWAADQEALDVFRPAADAICASLGQGYELIGASFVVASGECKDSEAAMHVDFGPPAIPEQVAATALLPLHPEVFPDLEGNLEWVPWDNEGRVAVQPYLAGQAVIFDGKLPHRTQPFLASSFAGRSGIGGEGSHEALQGLRVLASFSLARMPQDAPWISA